MAATLGEWVITEEGRNREGGELQSFSAHNSTAEILLKLHADRTPITSPQAGRVQDALRAANDFCQEIQIEGSDTHTRLATLYRETMELRQATATQRQMHTAISGSVMVTGAAMLVTGFVALLSPQQRDLFLKIGIPGLFVIFIGAGLKAVLDGSAGYSRDRSVLQAIEVIGQQIYQPHSVITEQLGVPQITWIYDETIKASSREEIELQPGAPRL